MICEEFDDVPPLEDMTHLLYQINKISNTTKAKAQSNPTASTPIMAVKATSPTPAYKAVPVIPIKEFAGLQKGFFSSNPKPKSAKKPSDDLPFIKHNAQKHNPFEIKEIQDLHVKAQVEQSKHDWMTPAFLESIQKSPTLIKAFQDPSFLALSQELAKDPVRTMQKVAQSQPKYLEALKEFSSLIGEAMDLKAKVMDSNGFKAEELNEFEQQLIKKVKSDSKVQVTVVQT